jgi:hypothetical protein
LPWLRQLGFSRLRITLRAQEPVRVAHCTLNAVRGWLGPALLHVEFCSFLRERPCPPCFAPAGCTYHSFFEGHSAEATKPFVFALPQPPSTLAEGDTLDVQLTLIGTGAQHQDKVAVAYLRFERGARLFNARFQLAALHTLAPDGTPQPYQVGQRPLTTLADLWATPHAEAVRTARRLRIHYETPTALMQGGRLLPNRRALTFGVLTRRLLKRLYLLATEHCGSTSPYVDVQELLAAADAIRSVESELYWREETRYSRRLESHQQFGGYIGSQLYEGDFTPFAPLLLLGEHLHVGKRATFGFGRIRVEEE